MNHRFTNELIHETSPYLLQHAHNPVNWFPWNPEVLEKAQKENKLLIISIGYAACHWCHVMEEECFEDETVALTMNQHFVNIKIDREERPDIDHIYMDALQMMTGHGGWPLNIVALPDGRPFWGATYVKKEQWISALEQLAELYRKDPEKILQYAGDLANGIKQINLVSNPPSSEVMTLDELVELVHKWYGYFDTKKGGYNRAPKFMMPGNLDFLLHFSWATQDKAIEEYLNVTLTNMAYGGIFDQLGGGFARYSVDTKWHVPHFEKMLYDNGLLTSVYAKAFAYTNDHLYKQIVEKTIDFMVSDLMNSEGGFYSSLDADSIDEKGELEEGAFYVWTEEELKILLSDRYEVFKSYFNINNYGHWENGNYVLIRDKTSEEVADELKIESDELLKIIEESRQLLLEARSKRPCPRLDDKILCSWNGLMLKGLTDAYRYLNNDQYLELALKNAHFIEENFIRNEADLFHSHKEGKTTIAGYLEDYASAIDGFIGLYEITFDEKWIQLAKKLADRCIENYFDQESKLFFFTSKTEEFVIRRTLETGDNVIPASNSMMCKNLFKLSRIFGMSDFEELANSMLVKMQQRMKEHPESHANWLHLVLYNQKPYYEVAIVGDAAMEKKEKLQSSYLPNTVFAGTEKDGELDLVQNRFAEGQTLIYVCLQGSCKLPVDSIEQTLTQLQSIK